jgi:dTDP-4-dehydrorhamnose reductase
MSISVFITGGSGLLALNWAISLRQTHSVTLALRTRNISVSGVCTRRSNLESVNDLIKELDKLRPDAVIHTAGLANVDECEAMPDMAHRVNVKLADNLARVCAKLELPLAHISTDHLFLGDVPLANEEQPVAPINVYARTKAEAECRVLDAHPNALVIRTNFFGWGTSYRRSYSDHIITALRSGRPIALFQDVFYTPILIETLSFAVHDLISLGAAGVFNVVGDERMSKFDFGLKLARRFGLDETLTRPGLLSDQPPLVKRPRDMSLSNRKICELLGRKLGGADIQIDKLYEQEEKGLAAEMGKL